MKPSSMMPLKRRREQKTDYRVRKRLLLSGFPSLIVRNSAKNTWVQVVKAQLGGDKVLASACTKQLTKEFGWKGSGGNTPAAYLTGLLVGLKSTEKGVREAILNPGIHGLVKGSIATAALKGAIDGGLKIPHSEEVLPTQERLEGDHISRYAESLREVDPEQYRRRFQGYLSRGVEPTSLFEHFREVRGRILGS